MKSASELSQKRAVEKVSVDRRCWVEIDLAALRHNYRFVKGLVGERVSVLAIVKADAYGHGALKVAAELMKCGATRFGVANVREAAELQDALSIDGRQIALMSPVLPCEREEVVTRGLCPVALECRRS